MKLSFLCVLCVLCGSRCSALDREAFTFTKYALDVQIEPQQQRLAVRGKITVRNDSTTPQKSMALQISSSLAWRSIRLDGKPVQFVSQPYASDIDHTGSVSEAIATFPQEIESKGTTELEVGYEGTIPLDATRLTRIGVPEEMARHTDWDQIGNTFTAVRGIGYVVWYPVATESANLSEGNSLFDTLGRWKAREQRAELKVNFGYTSQDELLVLQCSGEPKVLGSEEAGKLTRKTTECLFDTSIPVFAIGPYESLVRSAVSLSYFYSHKTIADNFTSAAEKAAPLVEDWFGKIRAPAQIVELNDPRAVPFESGRTLLTPFETVDSNRAEITIVHQLTHAAFWSPRPWIYEGLAHFSQALYREQQAGRQAGIDFMKQYGTSFIDLEKTAVPSDTSQSLINTTREEFSRSKAMYVWWMLRDMVGENSLKKALGAYRPDQDIEPAYLQRLLQEQSKKDLEWFFDDWVYRDKGLPDFRVASVYPRKTSNGSYLVTVTVENLGNAGAEVPVNVQFAGHEATVRLEVRSKSQASVRIVTGSFPEQVTLNDGSIPESDMTNNAFKVETPAVNP